MIRDEASQRQVTAADPAASTWLSANAGSGKTRVLTDRVARLLLEDVSPQNILCLTYTKAAAAEMQNRLFKRLGSWAMLDDVNLGRALRDLGVERNLDGGFLSKARTLFASAIETPGGLKIQTIHSFCGNILRRFPLEAGVSPQFREMEDRAAVLLRAEVVDEMAMGQDRPLVENVMRHFTGAEFDKFVGEIAGERSLFAQPRSDADISKALAIENGVTRDSLLSNVFSQDAVEILRDLARILPLGSKADNTAAAKLAAVNLQSPDLHDVARLEGILLFGDSAADPYGPKIGKFPTKALAGAHPELVDALSSVMTLVADSRQTRLALQAFKKSRALHDFGHRFVAAYAARKQAMGLLDFDDLIEKARDLLTDRTVADWVLYRLDGGIDHVLVDEAQDTSPSQWAVIENLTRELTAGDGARSDTPRTIFVVGDKKQSIYSFQGADPAEFDRMREQYQTALAAPGPGLQSTEMAHSFRSSTAVLRVVDAAFADPEKRAAIGQDGFHVAFKADLPGRVDLWPVIAPNEAPEEDGKWFDPVDTVHDTHHDVQLANRIASQIKHMIANEQLPVEIDSTGTYARRPITEGDFLILVQRRGSLFSEIIRACKMAGLQVAGADRFRVGAVLAVKDIAALLNFLALPEDDLSLAAALRSPLFGWSEQDLFSLAHRRPANTYLWEALRTSDAHPKTLAILHDLRKQADFMRPFDLIARILTRHDGRRKLLARLGAEAEDGIDAMLSQALSYESMGTPSLTGFLSWMETDELEVKRQMDNQGDQIRVMSVHGSKGLEAPIVILPDAATRKKEIKKDILPAGDLALWKTSAKDEPPVIAALRSEAIDAQECERLRLLYVAMTRAKKWLIVAAAGQLADDGSSWHDIVANGMAQSGAVDVQSGPLDIKRVAHADWGAGALQTPSRVTADSVPAPTFDALPPVTKVNTRAPSDLGGAKALLGETTPQDETLALAQGRVLHLLLEHLPHAPDRPLAAQRILANAPDVLPRDLADQLVADAMQILSNDELAHLFAPGTKAEVGLTAHLPEIGARIHGAIDRLVIAEDYVLAIDYKSNRLIPDSAENVPEGLLRQMGAYAAALAQIYPRKRIETAILWTRIGQLMPLPTQIVASALTRVTTS